MWMFGGGGGYGSNEAGLMLLYPQSLQLFFPEQSQNVAASTTNICKMKASGFGEERRSSLRM